MYNRSSLLPVEWVFSPYHPFSKKEITLFCMCYQHNMVEQCRYAQNSSKDNNQKHSSRYKCNLAGPHLVLMTTHFGDKDQPTKLQRPLLKNTMGYGSQTGQQDKESFKHTKRWRLDYITLTYSRHVIMYIKTFFK